MKKIKKIFLSVLLFVFSGFILFFSIKANANTEQLQRMSIVSTINTSTSVQSFYVLQIPNNNTIIENDDHTYSIVEISTNNVYSSYLGVKRNGVDSFLSYGYYGTSYNKTLYAIDFIGIYIKNTNENMLVSIYNLKFDANAQLYYDSTIASDLAFDTTSHNIRISALAISKFYIISNASYSPTQVANIMNSYLNIDLEGMIIAASNNGYQNGYYAGYADGQEGKNAITKVWDTFGGLFTLIGNVMSIELFPNIPLGLFFLMPLVFGAVGFIFWIWKRGS